MGAKDDRCAVASVGGIMTVDDDDDDELPPAGPGGSTPLSLSNASLINEIFTTTNRNLLNWGPYIFRKIR